MANPGWGTGPVEQILPAVPYADHYIVCGAGALAHRLVVELTEQYDVPVVAIVPDRERDHAPQILKILGESGVVIAPGVSEEALGLAQAVGARGIAFVNGDDQSNIHAALRAQAMNPGIRIVLRMYNQRLGEHIEKLFYNCAALSRSATAAPAFVNAALRRPNSVQIGGREVTIAQQDRIAPDNYLCTVADEIDQRDLSRMRLLPETPGAVPQWVAELTRQPVAATGHRAVLQFLESEPTDALPRISRIRWRLVDMWRFFTSVQLRMVLAASAALVIASFALIWMLDRPFGWAVYESLLDLAGSAVPDNFGQLSGTGGSWQRIAQVTITLCGIPLTAVVTAILVENAGQGRRGAPKVPSAGMRGHAVVIGLGNVGTRIATLLHQLNVPVVCVERDPTARGIAVARSLDIPVLVGEGPLDNQLLQARVQTARAVLAVTGDDATNLEAVLEARAVSPDVRVVLRLFDDDFANHVYRTFTNAASRSVSYLAAPAFAAALMGREVLGTLSVYRHVVLVAQFAAEEGSALVGMTVRDVETPGEVRVIAVRPRDTADYVWRPDHARRLSAGDSYVIVATRTGLGRHTTFISEGLVTASVPEQNRGPASRRSPHSSTGPWAQGGQPRRDRPDLTPEAGLAAVRIFLSDGRDHAEVEEGIEAWLSAAGVDVVRRDRPELGSWSRTLWVRVRAIVAGPVARQVAATLAHTAEVRAVTVTDAQVTAILMQSAAQALAALQNNDDAVVRVGAVLIVKVGGNPTVTQLSAAQQFKLDHAPELLSAPAQLLQWLSLNDTGPDTPGDQPRALDF